MSTIKTALPQWRVFMRHQLEALIGKGFYSQAGEHARLFNAVPCWARQPGWIP